MRVLRWCVLIWRNLIASNSGPYRCPFSGRCKVFNCPCGLSEKTKKNTNK